MVGHTIAPDSLSSAIVASVEAPVGERLVGVGAAGDAACGSIAPGVRLKRGAGAGWGTPSTSRTSRGRRCAGAPRLVHREHRREADVVPGEERDPLVARARVEERGHPLLSTGHCAVHLGRRVELDAERPEQPHQLGVELRLDSSDRDVPSVGTLVDVVEVRAAVEQVRAALSDQQSIVPRRRRTSTIMQRRSVDHRRVDHLPLAAIAALDQRGEDADTSSSPPPPKSPTRLSGGTGGPPAVADVREHAGERDVVDVVADVVRERTVLAPARHAAVDEARVAFAARRRDRRRAAPPPRVGSPR